MKKLSTCPECGQTLVYHKDLGEYCPNGCDLNTVKPNKNEKGRKTRRRKIE